MIEVNAKKTTLDYHQWYRAPSVNKNEREAYSDAQGMVIWTDTKGPSWLRNVALA